MPGCAIDAFQLILLQLSFMAGIYIHIPFCKTRCHYCNFFSRASGKHREEFLPALLREMELQQDYLRDEPVHTVYLGGGTPSLLSDHEIREILDHVRSHFRVDDAAEITLEANPDDINARKAKELLRAGIGRLSLGVQSFHDEDLAYLKRVHNAVDAMNAIKILQDSGLEDLTIDLIYGIPTLSDEKWAENLDVFFRFRLPHLSAYALTVEDKTPLEVLIRREKLPAPDEDSLSRQFKTLTSLTGREGYIHYEISNFALEGHYSKHNSLYWTGGHYLGLGPSAHSYNGISRRWNKASMKSWLALEDHYDESFEEEILSQDQRYNEYVMTSLRTVWGCDIGLVEQQFGKEYADHLAAGAEKYLERQQIRRENTRLFLTEKGKFFADGIAADLFI